MKKCVICTASQEDYCNNSSCCHVEDTPNPDCYLLVCQQVYFLQARKRVLTVILAHTLCPQKVVHQTHGDNFVNS